MVAAHRKGPLLDEPHHRLNRPFGIGAIADIVAEANKALGTVGSGGIKTCRERLPVGVNVRKKCQPHAMPPHRSRRPAPIPLSRSSNYRGWAAAQIRPKIRENL